MQAVVEQQKNSHLFNPSGSGAPQNPPASGNGCRVYTPNVCSLTGFNTWNVYNVNQNPKYSNYKPIMYGDTVQLSGAGLRVSQQRSFIPFEFYNQCTSNYCLSKDECPQGTIVPNPTQSEQLLFNDVFQSIDLDIGNTPPQSCVGIKRDSESSSQGWSTNEQGQLRWMQASQEQKNCQRS